MFFLLLQIFFVDTEPIKMEDERPARGPKIVPVRPFPWTGRTPFASLLFR